MPMTNLCGYNVYYVFLTLQVVMESELTVFGSFSYVIRKGCFTNSHVLYACS